MVELGLNGWNEVGQQLLSQLKCDDFLKISQVNSDLFEGALPGVTVTHERNAADIPWEVEQVVELGGLPATLCQGHLHGRVRRVLLAGPSTDDTLGTPVIMGVNHLQCDDAAPMLYTSSAETNGIALLIKVLNDEWGIQSAMFHVVRTLEDGEFGSFISDAGRVIPQLFPELRGRMDGDAFIVPGNRLSSVILNVQLHSQTTAYDVRHSLHRYADGPLCGWMFCVDDSEKIHAAWSEGHSTIVDASAVRVVNGDTVQLVAWVDAPAALASRIIAILKL